jgi:hypothetical protein
MDGTPEKNSRAAIVPVVPVALRNDPVVPVALTNDCLF